MKTDTLRTGAGYVPGLDGLRTIAIILVILGHVNHRVDGPLPPGLWEHTVGIAFGTGWVGVDLFFVLSGFLITRILINTKGSEHRFRNFYVRRILRILPIYYLYTGGMLLFHFLSRSHHWALTRSDTASLLLYYYNFHAALTGKDLAAFGHLWSLAVEEHFYLFWPLMVFVFSRSTMRRICWGIVASSLLLRLVLIHSSLGVLGCYLLTPCRLDGLAIGAWLALADQQSWKWFRANAKYLLAGTGLCLVGIGIYQGHLDSFISPAIAPEFGVRSSAVVISIGLTLLAVFFACVLSLAISVGRFTALLEMAPMRWLGKRSYGIYVYHGFILGHFAGIAEANHTIMHYPGWIVKIWIAVMTFGTTAVVAGLSYQFFEMPFLRIKRLFPNQIRRPSNLSPPDSPVQGASCDPRAVAASENKELLTIE